MEEILERDNTRQERLEKAKCRLYSSASRFHLMLLMPSTSQSIKSIDQFVYDFRIAQEMMTDKALKVVQDGLGRPSGQPSHREIERVLWAEL